jgi:hypothetical protein
MRSSSTTSSGDGNPVTGATTKLPAGLGFLAAAVCIVFAAWTKHAWEDYLITFRASLNLASGNGLVFQPGERVHSFTSPLGTLVPAAFAIGGGEGVEYRALWGLRIVSALGIAGALFLAVRRFQSDAVATGASAMAALMWLLDPKVVDFSVNGMECAFLVFFVTWSWICFARNASVLSLAAGLAGLQWSRPDGFIFFGALSLGWWWLGTAGTAGGRFIKLLRIGALGFALYLPWLIFATAYYGTPVPHTITAKQSLLTPAEVAANVALYPAKLLYGKAALSELFMPAYAFFGGWPKALVWFSRLLALGAALAWLWPRLPRPGRIASFAFFLGGFYVEYIPRSPWYYPVWQTLAFVSWAYLLDAVIRRPADPKSIFASLARIAGLTIVALQGSLLLAVALQMRTQQSVIETSHRREIGAWLKETSRAGDRVYLEPLGYIGYYSGLKMLDFPGLSSPEVVAVRKAGHLDHGAIITQLRPEWLVLRPDQIQSINETHPSILNQQYRTARVFDVRREVTGTPLLPGRGYLYFDAVFVVFERADRERTNDTD